MTDDEFWGLLLTDPATAVLARTLRRDPTGWRVTPQTTGGAGAITHVIRRLYLAQPLVDGAQGPSHATSLTGLPDLPARFAIHPPAP